MQILAFFWDECIFSIYTKNRLSNDATGYFFLLLFLPLVVPSPSFSKLSRDTFVVDFPILLAKKVPESNAIFRGQIGR